MEIEKIIKKKNNFKNSVEDDRILSPWKLAWYRLRRNKLAVAGLFILAALIIVSVIGPVVWPYKMESVDYNNLSSPPTFQHPIGTDTLGRDLFARLIYAGRISLSVGIFAVVVSIVIGTVLGGIAGYYGGVIDTIIMRVVDVFLCFPFFPLLITLGAVLSDLKVHPKYRIFVVMVMIGLLSWTGICRIVRGQILSLREMEFMQSAEALGLRDRKKIFRHILPNTFASIIVSATLGIGNAILTESALSYLGLGITPPTPSWGQMIQTVTDLYIMKSQPWTWIPPGICIFITVMAINLLGDGLRDALDPKLKR
jgi:peptide/nickel transport system permease protein